MTAQPALETAIAVTTEMLAELRPGEQVRVRPQSDLERDLGFDSLGLMELRERLEEALETSISDDALAEAVTLNDLLEGTRTAERTTQEPSTAPVREAAAGVAAPEDTDTLLDVLDWYVERHPDRLHVRLVGERGTEAELTFAGLREKAERIAAGLQNEGVEPGRTVALMLPTGLDYFASFFGALCAGAVPVPIYPPARPSQIEDHVRRHTSILRNAEARVLVTVPEAASVARLLRAQVPSLGAVATHDELANTGRKAAIVGASPDRLALLQYTSGSTATPKGVELTHANLLANIRVMADVVEIDPATDVFVSWLPLYHDMGLIGAWLGSLTTGMPLVVMSPFTFLSRPVRWLRAIEEHKGTISAAPNFAYELCCTRIDDDDLDGLDLASWRLALNGAEPVSADTLERFRDRFEPRGLRPEAITPVYGLAETAVGLSFPPPGRGPRIDRISRERFTEDGRAEKASDDENALRVVGCGHPLPGHEVRIVRDGDRAVGEREQGRIQFRGPSATKGYHRNPEETKRLRHGEWLDTGDLGYLASGEIFVTGRVKDMIIRGGRNLHPQEIEEAVGAINGVRTGCVAAFATADDASGTERLVVVAETRETDDDARGDLRGKIRGTVSDVAGLPPDEIVLAPPRAVLKTSSGKIRRGATRERWEAGELERAAPPVWRQILHLVRSGAVSQIRRSLKHALATAFGVWAWVATIVVGIPATMAIAVLPGRRLRWTVARYGLRAVLRLTRIRLDVEGAERMPDGPCVVIAPHGSPLDGPVLVAALSKPVTFVAIQEVRRMRVIGRLARRLGVEFVEREDRSRAAGATDRFVDAVGSGRRLVLFPESTMSRVRGLRAFRTGAFVTAARAGVPVVPVAIEGTREMVGPGGYLARPGRLKVTVGEPIEPRGKDWESGIDLRDRSRAVLLDLMDVPDLSRG